MPRRPYVRTPSRSLPFEETAVTPRNPLNHQQSPTAVISYAHETDEHNQQVLDLSKRLISEGVDCTMDKYEVSPREGWPIWMQKTIDNSDFIIAVCTDTYKRRFEGNDPRGTGKGARWEGRLIQQILYEEGVNVRVIPIVFDKADIVYIPSVLKSATHYDMSTKSGYRDLHRALTKQPRVEKPPLGSIPTRLPDLDPSESITCALLRLCPDPLPIEVVAQGSQS